MTETAILQEAIKRIEALEVQVADLRGIRLIKTETIKKPFNQAAFRKAVAAMAEGDRGQAYMEYRRYYRTPSQS